MAMAIAMVLENCRTMPPLIVFKWKRMAMTMEEFEICTVALLTACFQWKAMTMAVAMAMAKLPRRGS